MTKRIQAPYSTPFLPFAPDTAERHVVPHESGDGYQQNSEKEERNLSHSSRNQFLAVAPPKECAKQFTFAVSGAIGPDSMTIADAEEISHTSVHVAHATPGGRSLRVKRHKISEPAKPKVSLYISSFLPFPHDSADCLANPLENSASYMQSGVDEGEIQNRHNAYMSTQAFAIGTQDALALRDRARIRVIAQTAARTPLQTLADLLAAISPRPEWAKDGAMLRTVTHRLTEMLGQPADRVPVDQLPSIVSRFRDHLQGRRHSRNAVRSYLYYLRLLIRACR